MNRLVFGKAVVVGLMLVLVLGGCSKKEGGNGGGGGAEPAPEPTPDKVTFSLRYPGKNETDEDYSARTSANWDGTTKTTTISGWKYESSNNPMISISFPGAAPGTFKATDKDGGEIRYINEYGAVYVGNDDPSWVCSNYSYEINVTKYGPVGSTIEGTFQGQVGRPGAENSCASFYTIRGVKRSSNGEFRVTRIN